MSQVNNLAGEEAVGHAVVLAYMLCTRDTSKYAKPEVDPPTLPPLYLLLFFSSVFTFSLCLLLTQ